MRSRGPIPLSEGARRTGPHPEAGHADGHRHAGRQISQTAGGILKNLDESDEINACTVKIDVEIDGRTEPWLLLFKNETHNHPTEIEPFGGAATCIGGAIRTRSPAARLRLSGDAHHRQRRPATAAVRKNDAAASCRSAKSPFRLRRAIPPYGNQIGLATGVSGRAVRSRLASPSAWSWARSSARFSPERRTSSGKVPRAGGRRRAAGRAHRP